MTKDEVIAAFGVDPDAIGHRPRGWWIVERIEEEEEQVGAQIGDLCVKTRDGGYNPIDPDAFRVGHCLGSVEDSFDETYRYYFYRRLDRPAGPADVNRAATASAEGRSETVSEVCGFHCPACGNDGVAFMLEGRIVALPHAPALRCQHCETEFRIALYAAEGRSDE